ncbi:hypothetical protein FACS189423_11260 [Bacteroidia bacterium]|nr:hypothetical protein FACS189423_11260 [Bacteroidia bacterium]
MMHSADNWKIEVELVKYLANQLNKGRLCIVLGAGISSSFGLPNWEKLIKNLYDAKGLTRTSSDLMVAAEDYKRQNPVTYVSDVQAALYKDSVIDFKELSSHHALAAIGALVMASKRGSSSKVITFNFDNVLELYLNYFGFVSSSQYEEKHWATNADVEIYHPHGFLSHDGKIMSYPILDQKSYSQNIGNRTKLWNVHSISNMLTHTCLFIGLSGNDLNLDSMIQTIIDKDNHKSIQDGYPYWGVSFINDDNKKTQWTDRKIFPFKVNSDFSNLPDFLFSIAQQAAQQRMDEYQD